MQSKISVVKRADMAAGEERLRADASERLDGFGAPPKERQRRCDHFCPPNAENDQKVLDDTGQLNADDGVHRKRHAAQPPRDCVNNAVSFGVSDAPRLPVGKALAIFGIDEGKGIRTPPGGRAEQFVDGDAARVSRRRSPFVPDIAKDHCSARFGWRHHVSGRYPESEVRDGCAIEVQRATHWSGR